MIKETIPYFTTPSPYEVVYKKSSTNAPVGPHTHDSAEIYLTMTPLPDILLNNTLCKAPAGTLIVIPPFCIHQLYHEIDKTYERYILTINTHWLENIFFHNPKIFSYLTHADSPLLLPLQESEVKTITTLLNHFTKNQFPQTPTVLSDFFIVLNTIHNFIRQHETTLSLPLFSTTTSIQISEVLTYIQENLSNPLTVTEIAAHFFLNADYLSRLFKKHTHISLGHYITLQKISVAQKYLHEGKTITQTQELLGYSSYAHFFKTFKKVVGITPSQYKSHY